MSGNWLPLRDSAQVDQHWTAGRATPCGELRVLQGHHFMAVFNGEGKRISGDNQLSPLRLLSLGLQIASPICLLVVNLHIQD